MAALAAATTRQLPSLAGALRLSSCTPSTQAAKLLHRRGLAGGGDHHGPPKINCWQDPMSPSKWKEEHFVIVSLTGWGLPYIRRHEDVLWRQERQGGRENSSGVPLK